MLPEHLTRLGLGFHIASILVGVLAIITRDIWIARITGICLLATGINLLYWMIHLLRQRPEHTASD
jgi:protein-S-isoprenylcysteine O-methyltransferase Ste14